MGKICPAITRLLKDGPGVHTAGDILYHVDATSLWSKATSFVDVSYGPGQITVLSCRRWIAGSLLQSARIVALNDSLEILQQLAARIEAGFAAEHAAWSKVETKVDDVHEPSSVPEDSATHIAGLLVCFLLPEPRRAVEAARSALTPANGGGVFAMSAMIDAE